MEPIVARYQWTVEELATAYRWHYRQSTRAFFKVAIILLAALFCVAGIGISFSGEYIAGGAITFFGCLVLLWWFVGPESLARFQFRRNRNLHGDIEWQIFPQRIDIVAPRSKTEAEWSLFSKIVATGDGLLFYLRPQFFYWIPRNSFVNESDFEAVIDLAKKNSPQFSIYGEGSRLSSLRFSLRSLLWATFWVCV